jgi:hypothetical protein
MSSEEVTNTKAEIEPVVETGVLQTKTGDEPELKSEVPQTRQKMSLRCSQK